MTDKTLRISADEYQRRLKAGTLETSSKYHNHKVHWGDMVFDSKWEWERYMILVEREANGEISDLQRQVSWELQPAFVRPNGESVKAIHFIVDFKYLDRYFRIFEDAKGMETDVFKMKWKMLKYIFRNDEHTLFRLTKRGETIESDHA